MKSIFKAVATVTIFSIITRALGFLFRIFLSRKLGAEGLGLYQMAISVLGIFVTLVSSGIPLTTAKQVSKYEVNNQLKTRNQVVGSSLIIAMVVAVICSGLILVLKSVWGIILTDNRAVELMIILIPSIAFSAIYSVFRGALWGENNYFSCGLTELLEQIIRFALTFVMLFNITDYFVAAKWTAIAFNLTCLASALITIFIYFKHGKISFRKGVYKSIIKSASPITGVRLANSLVQPLTSILIPTMLVFAGYTKSEAVASFGVIMGMTFPMLFVPMSVIGSISMVLIPSISAMASRKEYDSINKNVSSALDVSLFISMIFIPVYLSIGDLIGIVLYNNIMSGVLLQLAAVCVLPITLCNLTGSILNALNLEIKSFVNYIIGSVVLFASIIIFTPLIGINSVVVSFFLSMGSISLLNLMRIKKHIKHLQFNLVSCIAKYCLIIIPVSLLCHFISNILGLVLNAFFTACITGCICVGCTLLLCQMFKVYNVKNIFTIIKNKNHTKQQNKV